MKLKPGVVLESLSPPMWYAVGFIEAAYQEMAGREVVVTSTNDGDHAKGSKHYTNLAFDVRTLGVLTAEEKMKILAFCKAKLDARGFDTMIHGPIEHLHCEYDPKPGERLWTLLKPEQGG